MERRVKLNPHWQRKAIARREAGEALGSLQRSGGRHTTIGRLRA